VDRSFAARLGSSSRVSPIGRLARPLSFALPRGASAKRLGIALVVLALLGGGWLLLRKSPLVSVEHVQISGVQGVDAAPIDAALRSAARQMSTLEVNVGALQAAVARFRVVRGLSVSTSFPHGLRIDVVEQPPVAAVTVAGVRTAVAADGVVLGPTLSGLLSGASVQLPAITDGDSSAPADLRSVGGRVEGAGVRAELSVLGAAPRVLLGWVARVYTGGEGLTVAMRNGLSIYFGDAARPRAKWLSAARVLADPSSAGATYVDVRAPERPAAGTTAAGGLGGSATTQAGASDPTSAALASVLAEAINGGSGAATAPATTPATTPAAAPAASPAPATAPTGSSTTEPSSTGSSAAGANEGASPET
jgi:cell division protein FtsQ